MLEWLSYRPSDFLLFGPEAYWRLFQDMNAALWPMTPVCLALCVALMRFPHLTARFRCLILIFLAFAWGFVAWRFFGDRYATINWAAPAVGVVFGLQATGLLIFSYVAGEPRAGRSRVGLALILYASLLYPFWPLINGRPFIQAEVFGLAPDPTAIATLGLILFMHGGLALGIIPFLWLCVSAATLLAMGQPEGVAVVAALAIWTLAIVFENRRSPSPPSRNLRL